MKAWNAKVRHMRPFKRLNDKIRALRDNILESACIPFAGEYLHFDVLDERRVTVEEEKAGPRDIRQTMAKFNDGAGATSWLGVIPYRHVLSADIGPHATPEDVEIVPPQSDGDHQYHYRLRRIQLVEDHDDDEDLADVPAFITPIPSVRMDTPNVPLAPRKSEGTYSRYYSMLDRGLVSTSFDELRPTLPQDASALRLERELQRHPKLAAIFGRDGDSGSGDTDGDTPSPRKALFVGGDGGEGWVRSPSSTASAYKYHDETVRDSTEVFMHAGILLDGAQRELSTSGSSRIFSAQAARKFYLHDNETILQLPSIASDSASLDILSQQARSLHSGEHEEEEDHRERRRGAGRRSDSSSATSEEEEEDPDAHQHPISVSISKLGSPFMPYSPRLEDLKEHGAAGMILEHIEGGGGGGPPLMEPGGRIRTSKRFSNLAIIPADYSFISFSTPSRISLAIPAVPVPELAEELPGPGTAQVKQIPPNEQPTVVANAAEGRGTVAQDVKLEAQLQSKVAKRVRIAAPTMPPSIAKSKGPSSGPRPPPNPDRSTTSSTQPRVPSLEPSSSFARDLNHALVDVLEHVTAEPTMSGLSSNAADGIVKIKLDKDGGGAAGTGTSELDSSEYSNTLPPSALLSPVSKFSEGECSTLTYHDEYPYEPSPSPGIFPAFIRPRRRKFVGRLPKLSGKSSNRQKANNNNKLGEHVNHGPGASLNRTKTNLESEMPPGGRKKRAAQRQAPVMYRKLVDAYLAQYNYMA